MQGNRISRQLWVTVKELLFFVAGIFSTGEFASVVLQISLSIICRINFGVFLLLKTSLFHRQLNGRNGGGLPLFFRPGEV